MTRQRLLQLLVAAAVVLSVGLIALLLADAPPEVVEESVAQLRPERAALVIAGRVVDSAGRPIKGAQVQCGAVRARSREHGMFVCRKLAPGGHMVDAQTPGIKVRRVIVL